MSSNYEQARFPLRRVALFGGGRWSRVLLPVIRSLLNQDAEIVWITKHGYSHAMRWLTEKAIEQVEVRSDIDLGAAELDAAVVATSPSTHAGQVSQLLKQRIPTLCEKPLTLDFDEAVALHQTAVESNCPLGVNLEMYFASFVEDFAAAISSRTVHQVEMTWLDPWTEERYGEIKHGDIYTSMVNDMWPHCWSLLRRLFPYANVDSIEKVRYEPSSGSVSFWVTVQKIPVSVQLSRRSDRRVRRIDLNHGTAVLDFSTEPGSTTIDGAESSNMWRGTRPLSRSLSSFFEVALEPKLAENWPLSGCLDAVKSAQQIGKRLTDLQREQLKRLNADGIELANASHRNLIVDLLLPEYAETDRRWPAITIEDQIEFVRHVCVNNAVRCR